MHRLLQSYHPFRIFAISGSLTLAIGLVYFYIGPQAAILALLLIAVEITFSFDNAIGNARELDDSYVSIASFGGMFSLMLSLHIFFNASRKIRWIDIIEKPLQRIGRWWTYAAVCLVVLLVLTLIPFNSNPVDNFMAGFMSFLYLEHGAHYTIAMLAGVLLTGIFFHISEFITGTLGIIVIGAAIVSSLLKRKYEEKYGQSTTLHS